MKCMNKNKVPFFYALYEDKEPITDDYGNITGEYDVIYGNPKSYSANISAALGETSTQLFGEDISYDKVIVMDSESPPIDEYSILWIDTVPQLDEDGSLMMDGGGNVITPYDYTVHKVAKSLNSILIAISKVNVSG